MRPVLRYHGGKWKLAPWLISYFPRHRVYVEPFGGAASVLLRKERCYAEVYNDLDEDIVNVFSVLRDKESAGRLKELLSLTPFSRKEFELAYQETSSSIERARRTIIRAFMGFGSGAASGNNTGFRGDSNRSGTTPAHDWVNYHTKLGLIINRLQGVVIECMDYQKLIQKYDTKDTLFYIDPPYLGETRNHNRKEGIYRYEMEGEKEHMELSDILKNIDGMAVVSGYPSKLYDDIYGEWKTISKKSYADGASERVEKLWISPNCKVDFGPMFEARK